MFVLNMFVNRLLVYLKWWVVYKCVIKADSHMLLFDHIKEDKGFTCSSSRKWICISIRGYLHFLGIRKHLRLLRVSEQELIYCGQRKSKPSIPFLFNHWIKEESYKFYINEANSIECYYIKMRMMLMWKKTTILFQVVFCKYWK